VAGMAASNGMLEEAVVYDTYGQASVYDWPSGDVDRDGDVDQTDVDTIDAAYQQQLQEPLCDINLSGGTVNAADKTVAIYQKNVGKTPDLCTYSSLGNPYLFTGRTTDTLCATSGLVSEDGSFRRIQDNRNRMYDPTHGRWFQRDPLLYLDGMNLYEYLKSHPSDGFDPFGMATQESFDQWWTYLEVMNYLMQGNSLDDPMSSRSKACKENTRAIWDMCSGANFDKKSEPCKKILIALYTYCHEQWYAADATVWQQTGRSPNTVLYDVMAGVGAGLIELAIEYKYFKWKEGTSKFTTKLKIGSRAIAAASLAAGIADGISNYNKFNSWILDLDIQKQYMNVFEGQNDGYLIKEYGACDKNANIRGSAKKGEFRECFLCGAYKSVTGEHITNCDSQNLVYVLYNYPRFKPGNRYTSFPLSKGIATHKSGDCLWSDELVVKLAKWLDLK